MFRNYVVTALRNAGRHKLYSFITIAGLTVALTCSIFILAYISNELSYDRFIPNMASVYRVDFGYKFPGRDFSPTAVSPFPLGPAMKSQIPEVVAYTRIVSRHVTLKVDGRLFGQTIEIVDPDFFTVIPLDFVAGDPRQALTRPDSIVISRKEAYKLFGTVEATGRTVTINGNHPMIVTAILKDLPQESQLKANVLIPNTSKADPTPNIEKSSWDAFFSYLYVRLSPGSRPKRVLSLVKKVFHANFHPQMLPGVPIPTMVRPHLTPFVQVHLSPYRGGLTPNGSWIEIYGVATIAVLLLLIACFNFTNLTTAQAIQRTREVALRKALGARRTQLMVQFLAESVVTAAIALILALAIVELLTPWVEELFGQPLGLHFSSDWRLLVLIIILTVGSGLFGGFYPALVLSSFRPAVCLRDGGGGQNGSVSLRTGLVILQFAGSIGLGIAAIVVFVQIHYARQVNLGFNRANIVVVSNVSKLPKTQREDFARMVSTDSTVTGVALSQDTPFEGAYGVDTVRPPGAQKPLAVLVWDIGFNYFHLYRMALLAGRLLSSNRATDSWSTNGTAPFNAVISESTARIFGYAPSEAIGKVIRLLSHPVTIVGVVNDQRLEGPGDELMPEIFVHDSDMRELSIRVRAGRAIQAVSVIKRDWHIFAPNTAMEWHFLDNTFSALFAADVQRERVFALCAGIAVFVAGLGLYGLAAITVQSRTKEIGIRKTFGARTHDIVGLLLWQFSVPILLANIIAWPISWYYLHEWLQGFPSRIVLSPAYFIGAGVIALLIAWTTVIAQATRAARAKPVDSLHYE